MAAEPGVQGAGRMLRAQEESKVLSDQWRVLARAATFVAVLTAPRCSARRTSPPIT